MYTQARPSGESFRIKRLSCALKLVSPDIDQFTREQVALRSSIFQFSASQAFYFHLWQLTLIFYSFYLEKVLDFFPSVSQTRVLTNKRIVH